MLMLVCAAGLAFGFSLSNGFVSLDDSLLIYQNPAVQELTPRSLTHIFTSYDPELYVPLTLLSYQLEHAIGGLRPWIFHLSNLLLHMGSVLLLFSMVRRLTRDTFIAFITALLFTIHPLQTEAVVWAAARKDVLSGFFFLLSVLLYVRHRETSRRSFLLWSTLCFTLALMAKVSVIMLPFLLMLIDWREDGQWSLSKIIKKWPYLLLSGIFGIIAIAGKSHVLASSGFRLNVLLGLKSTAFYLYKIAWPFGLTPIYPQEGTVSILAPDILLSAIIVGTLSGLALFLLWKGKARTAAFGLTFFLLMLLPNYTNFLKNGFLFFASDRYAYLASIGMFLLIAAGIARVLRNSSLSIQNGMMGLLAVLLIFLGVRTSAQSRTWKDSEHLYRHVLSVYSRSTVALNNLGDILIKAGRSDEGITYIEEALKIQPTMMTALINKGSFLEQQMKLEEAIGFYRKAVASVEGEASLNLDELGPYYYLGNALDKQGKTEESIAEFQRAVAKAPQFGEPHYNLGIMLQKHGKIDEARAAFERSIKEDPMYIASHYHLAGIYAEKGMLQEAALSLETVIKLNPRYEKAQEHLANIQGMLSR